MEQKNNNLNISRQGISSTERIAIIKYNAGNVQSVQYALDRLGISSIITDDEAEIRTAAKVIFPGVGHAGAAMQNVREKGLDKLIPSLQQPVLGICVGMQLMCKHSEEGDTTCMGIFDTAVKLFKSETLKIPQIGWNLIYDFKSPLFYGLNAEAYIYNVHSYYATLNESTVATCNYVQPYSAALQKDNFYAVQFHPEKSGATGEAILKNFLLISS
jgi:imidazole glycerol-phosphate synthase subunit HisH